MNEAPAAARLRIRTLGVLTIADPDGRPISAASSQRRPMAVLVVAAAAGERGITRDKLVGLLWPDSSSDRARHSLTQAIYNARRVTGIDQLFLTQGVLRVNAALVTSDVADFEAAVRDRDLERIASMYGGPFLDGFFLPDSAEFEHWVSAQRARFEEHVVAALGELAERATRDERQRDAVEWRRRLAALRPLDSGAAAGLVLALGRAGDRAGALRCAQEHVARLRAELEIDPDPAFVRLVDNLREAAPAAVAIVRGPDAELAPDAATASLPRIDDVKIMQANASNGRDRARRTIRGRWRAMAALGAASITGIVAWQVWPRAPVGDARPPMGLVSVAPFKVTGAAPSIAYLGRGASQLLAMRLDSVALGAHRVVVGSVVGSRARAIIAATLLDSVDGRTVAHGTVEGAADSLGSLTSQLAAKLVLDAADEDSSLATRWRTPMPALAAFIDGRRAFRHGAYLEAARSYRAALALDSTFAPAALQLARAADRLGDLDQEDGAVARAWPYRAAFGDGERTQLIALAGPLYPRATPRQSQLDAWAHVVRVSPNRASSWYDLGARLVREGRRVGADAALEQAAIALNHALLINPRYEPAHTLLSLIALRAGAPRKTTSSLAALDSAAPLATFVRWRSAMAQGDSETVKDLRDSWPSLSMESARAIAMASQFDAIGLGDGSRAIGLMATRATTTSERVDAALAAHSLALNTGRPVDALVQANRLRELRPDSHASLRLRVLDALYGGGDSLAGHDAARALEAPLDSVFRDFPLVRSRGAADACVLGQWRLAHADTTDVQPMLQLLRASQRRDDQPVSAAPWVCADLIEAQLAVATGRRDALARVDRLDALVLTSAVAGNISLYANIALARMYSALGHPHRALATLRRRTYMAGWPAYLATAWREEAALARAIGDGPRAERSSGHLSSLTAAGRSAAQLPH